MKRRVDFETFLRKKSKSLSYVRDNINYCENVEKAFGGIDMDDIISSHQNISKARTKLEAMFHKKTSVDNYMGGLNRYLEFSVDASLIMTSAHIVSTSVTPSLYHVARGKSVALTPDVAFAAQVLEQEYAGVIQFARKLLNQGAFDYIPVIISAEMPDQDGPEEVRKVMGSFFPGPRPHIEIYYKNIESGNAAKYRNCLAHEYLHYLHYICAGAEYSNASRELKEALADFFSVLYSIDRHGKDDLVIARSRYRNWEKFEGCWPYAFALYFYTVHGRKMKFSPNYSQYETHGSVGKYVEIFLSTTNPDTAFEALVKA